MRLHLKATDNPAKEMPFRDLPAEVAAELLGMLGQAQQQQGGPPLNPVILCRSMRWYPSPIRVV